MICRFASECASVIFSFVRRVENGGDVPFEVTDIYKYLKKTSLLLRPPSSPWVIAATGRPPTDLMANAAPKRPIPNDFFNGFQNGCSKRLLQTALPKRLLKTAVPKRLLTKRLIPNGCSKKNDTRSNHDAHDGTAGKAAATLLDCNAETVSPRHRAASGPLADATRPLLRRDLRGRRHDRRALLSLHDPRARGRPSRSTSHARRVDGCFKSTFALCAQQLPGPAHRL